MKMKLSDFIQSPGIPRQDSFYLSNQDVFGGCPNAVVNSVYLNRSVPCGLVEKIRRKAFYDYGIGTVPVNRSTAQGAVSFWGRYDGDINLESVKALFRSISKSPDADAHVIIVGQTDDAFDEEYAALIPGNVKTVFALNCNVDHPKVHWYPIGRDTNGTHGFDISPKADKQNLVYCNFSPATHPARYQVLKLLDGKDFINMTQIEGYGHYTGYPMSNEEFLGQLNDHAFCICPRGAGFDTYRVWDSLHLGVIPITVREAFYHRYLDDLPILFLDSVEEFGDLTAGYLEKKYGEMLDTEYDFGILTATYWSECLSNTITAGSWTPPGVARGVTPNLD